MTAVTDSASLVPCAACTRVNPSGANFCAFCGIAIGAARPADGPGPAPAVADPLIGRVIADRYRILELLGRGGMGVVYKVEHVAIHKWMAMKLLAGELARDKDVVKRFRREAEAVSKLSHPNTVQTFDFGRSEGLMYLVMEFLAGRDFGAIIQQSGALPFARVARICAQVCASVGEAHEHGIVHRDLKPENIMVLEEKKDFVKVLDFGLAKLREQEEAGMSLTRAGHIIGTPYYMAPEHIRGENVDHRSDIYALGAVIYKAVAGVPPFWAPTPMAVLTKHLTEDLVLPSIRLERAQIPRAADAIVRKAMQKSPADRYQKVEELREDLLAYLESIGESETDDPNSSRSGTGTRRDATGRSTTKRKVQVATRGDIDHYERRLRARSSLQYIFALLVVGGLAFGGYQLYQRREQLDMSTTETEPNNELAEATPLREGAVLSAFIGRREGPQVGDYDIYEIRNPGGDRRFFSFQVTGIPNIDLVVDVVRAGVAQPVLALDSGTIGDAEALPAFPINAPTYYLRVGESPRGRAFPTENVSDQYQISWRFVQPAETDEHEINDSLELAEAIRAGQPRRGYIGWANDVDLFCADADAAAGHVTVSGIAGMDLVLRIVDRSVGQSTKLDAAAEGEGESSAVLRPIRARQTCFEVSADLTGSTNRASATTPYELRFEEGG